MQVYRSSGAGGQHINKTSSAIRVTHIPTNTVVECQDERSQHKNKDKALSVLRSRLYEAEVEKQRAAIAADRKSQVAPATVRSVSAPTISRRIACPIIASS